MKIQQISLFMENKPGRLVGPCRELAEAGINVLTLSLADTKQFGILRLIVRDWQRAFAILEKAGYVAKLSEVIVFEAVDRAGQLASILSQFEKAGVNIEYLYAFTLSSGTRSAMVLRCDDSDKATAALASADVRVISESEIYSLLEGKA